MKYLYSESNVIYNVYILFFFFGSVSQVKLLLYLQYNKIKVHCVSISLFYLPEYNTIPNITLTICS